MFYQNPMNSRGPLAALQMLGISAKKRRRAKEDILMRDQRIDPRMSNQAAITGSGLGLGFGFTSPRRINRAGRYGASKMSAPSPRSTINQGIASDIDRLG